MLFNSAIFIFIFLPLTLFLYSYTSKRISQKAAILSLVLCSLSFYGWWNPAYLPILLCSILFNYFFGNFLSKRPSKVLLGVGISSNLFILIYYKYTNFIVDNLNSFLTEGMVIDSIILPLAISFFTFQQIAYLVDSYKGITAKYSFLDYSLFVSFFPQLIAGPIVHHKEMLPQFSSSAEPFKIRTENLIIGLTIFSIGLFKKTVIADGISVYATPVFALVDSGQSVDFFQAWGGVLAYTFQLYFDFSGYSDMALGLARLFGIILPLNFYSPYKSVSIIEFWRRWHITLSRFLRDYIYIPLGGSRKGKSRRYLNLLITMLLGGIWHGAGWNFLIWGALHGSYLTINHAWSSIRVHSFPTLGSSKTYIFIAWLITFVSVCFGWAFFRATTFEGAMSLVTAMTGNSGFHIPKAIYIRLTDFKDIFELLSITPAQIGATTFIQTWLWNFCLLLAVILLPSVQDLFFHAKGSLGSQHYQSEQTFWPFIKRIKMLKWSSNTGWSVLAGITLALGILTLGQVSEFLYFQF